MSSFFIILLLVLGGLLSASNWITLFLWFRWRQHASVVPLLGGVMLMVGLIMIKSTRPFAWAGLLADYGTLILLWSLPKIFCELWQTSRFQIVHQFISEQAGRRDDIRLFKSGIFTIQSVCIPPILCNSAGVLIQSFGLIGRWHDMGENFRLDGYREQRTLVIRQSSDKYTATEIGYPLACQYPYDAFDGREMTKIK